MEREQANAIGAFVVRQSRALRSIADVRRRARRMNEMDRVVRATQDPQLDKPDTFYATSGTSQVEKAGDRWLPHDHRPVIGFTPNPASHSGSTAVS